MFYLIPSGKPINYDNTNLVGYDLIKKIDSILDGNLDIIYSQEYLSFKAVEVIHSKLSTVYRD